jgi:hypothetical protein
MEWLVEAAKQVPALAVLGWLVYYFLKDRAIESQKSEERLKQVIADRDLAAKLMMETISANNSALSAVQVFMSILEREHKQNAKSPRA